MHNSVADPGFPRGGGANRKGGAPTYYLANFSRKLHENEEILGGGGVPVKLNGIFYHSKSMLQSYGNKVDHFHTF